jgi:hypothetical protein
MMQKHAKSTDEETPANNPDATEISAKQVTWNHAQMRTEYANVVNVVNTREEFSLLFGLNDTWAIVPEQGFEVKLSNRVILTAYAAKRLQVLLTERIADYERRFGALNLGG